MLSIRKSSQASNSKKRGFILAILLLSFWAKVHIWSVVLSIDERRFLSDDSLSYINTAQAFLRTGSFAMSPETPNVLQSHRTPGFPLLIAGVHTVFGESQGSVVYVLILLSLATICLAYSIAYKIWGARPAFLAALLLGLDVASLSYALEFLTETLFTLLITATLLAGVCFFKTNGAKKWALGAGITLTLATFVRPISYYLIFAVALGFLVWSIVRSWKWNIILGRLLILVLPFILMTGAWQLRNYLSLGSSQFSSISSTNIFLYRAAAVVALRDGISLEKAREQLKQAGVPYTEPQPEAQDWRKGQIGNHFMKQGMTIISKHPFLFLQSQITGIIPMMLGGGEGPLLRMLGVPIGRTLDREIFDALSNFDIFFFFRRFASGTALVAFFLAVLYLGIVYAGVLSWLWHAIASKQISAIHLFMWMVMCYFIVISAGPEAGSRFRVPIMPILTLYAAQGLLQWIPVRHKVFYD